MRCLWLFLFTSLLGAGCAPTDTENIAQAQDSLKAQIALGKQLFFDVRLSRDNSISCASCHQPELAFSDTVPKSKGFGGKIFLRNSPSLLNAGSHPYFFADGGAPTLETQAIQPIEDEHEMNMPLDQLAYRIRMEKGYDKSFRKAFGKAADEYGITHSLAAYVRSLTSAGSPYDSYLSGKSTSLNTEQLKGKELFFGKAKCGDCHSGKLLSNFQFYDVGTGSKDDAGRERITLRPADRNQFKTPVLRNLTVTAPYMHNGNMATLKEVVEHFDARGQLNLLSTEKDALIKFMESLTDTLYISVDANHLK